MSRQRFCQEAVLVALRELMYFASPANLAGPLTEELAEQIAKEAVLIGWAVDEFYGNDTLPRKKEDA